MVASNLESPDKDPAPLFGHYEGYPVDHETNVLEQLKLMESNAQKKLAALKAAANEDFAGPDLLRNSHDGYVHHKDAQEIDPDAMLKPYITAFPTETSDEEALQEA